MSRPTIYIIDASSYVYRAFYALPPLSSPSGEPVNAVYGFTTMMLKLLRDTRPEMIVAVFDSAESTFRDALYPEYKANRSATPPELVTQMNGVRAVAEALRVPALCTPGVEADDVIASLASRAQAGGYDATVITGDKDLAQIVSPHVHLWDTMRDRRLDPAGVRQRFGVEPGQIADLMALVGDPVDNVPGVPGIGAKTAAALLQRFKSFDAILENVDAIPKVEGLRGAAKIMNSLYEHAELGRLSLRLTRLRDDLPLDLDLDNLRYRGADPELLRGVFNRYGFQRLLKDGQVQPRAAKPVVEPFLLWRGADIPEVVCLAREQADVGLACSAAGAQVRVAVVSKAWRGLICCAPEEVALLVPLLEDPAVHEAMIDVKQTLHALGPGFDAGANVSDVMIASYLMEASATHRLDELSEVLLGESLPSTLSESERLVAAASVALRLAGRLEKAISEAGIAPLYFNVEIPLTMVLARMERCGILVDRTILAAVGAELNTRMRRLEDEIYELAGERFNIGSPGQLREILFDKLKLSTKGVRRGKTGLSTDVDVLTRLAAVHPLPGRILEYRSVAKLVSTYVEALAVAINPRTGRLHSTFNQTVAATGRLSSSDPNLQNIPIRGDDGRRIRSAFVAGPGHHLLVADYSQIELRILAHLSADEALCRAFHNGADIHAETASAVFGVLPGLITPEMRRVAKVINFGVIYGMGAVSLAKEIGSSVGEANRYIEEYFHRHSGIREYFGSLRAAAREQGFVTTLLGRRRSVANISSPDRALQQAAERIAINTPIQGSAADLIKIAMVRLDRELRQRGGQARLLLQVHDELVIEVPDEQLADVRDLVRSVMQEAYPLRVPLVVSIGEGTDWAQAH